MRFAQIDIKISDTFDEVFKRGGLLFIPFSFNRLFHFPKNLMRKNLLSLCEREFFLGESLMVDHRILFLWAYMMVISWGGVFAGAPDSLGDRMIPEGVWTQKLLLGEKMIPDTIWHVLKNLSFGEGRRLLSVDTTHQNHFGSWKNFADVHGVSLTKDTNTAENVRECIQIFVKEMRRSFRIEIQSAKSVALVFMPCFLKRAQEKSFLWNTLVTTLLEKVYPEFTIAGRQEFLSIDAASGDGVFIGISHSDCRAYLSFVASRKDSDGTPALGAKLAQQKLNHDAAFGDGVFGSVSPEVCREYLEGVAARKNPDGSPDFCAEHAQEKLNMSAFLGRSGFTTKDRGTPTSAYDYLVTVAGRRKPDGTPGLGAENAQQNLNEAAFLGKFGFKQYEGKGVTSGYAYLVAVAKRKTPDGSPDLGAVHAQKLLERLDQLYHVL